MTKPILCLDYDGVIHSYSSPWQGVDVIPDPPVPGALEWIRDALHTFEIHVYSRRSIEARGRAAMQRWFVEHGAEDLSLKLTFAHEKPAAFLTIDDRAVCFMGDWSKLDPKVLRAFRPWNR